jgi:uroporphyrinogen-III synthase
MSGRLDGRRVLVTRAEHQAQEIARLLRSEGAVPLLIAAIAIEPLLPPETINETAVAVWSDTRTRWVVLTSANAVTHLLDALRDGIPGDVHAAAVGPATDVALRERGVVAEVVSGGGGEALAAALVAARVRDCLVWLPQALGARPETAEALRAAGASVVVTPLYRTVPPEGLAGHLRTAIEGRIDAAVFFSPTAVNHVMASVALAADIVAVCIGATTAEAARVAGLADVHAAAATTPAEVVEALVHAL